MENEKDQIKKRMRIVYNGQPWYGKSVKRVLSDITPKQAVAKPENGAHSIAELVSHMIEWRRLVQKRLSGDADYEVDQKESFRWQNYGETPENAWQNILEALDNNQKDLLDYISEITSDKLDESVPNRDYRFRDLIEGVIQHDIYHLGQIVLIHKYVID